MELFFIIGFGMTIVILISQLRSENRKNQETIHSKIVMLQKDVNRLRSTPLETSQSEAVKSDFREKKAKSSTTSGQRKKSPEKQNKPSVSHSATKDVQKEKKEESTVAKKQSKLASDHQQKIEESNKNTAKKVTKEKRDYERLIGENWLNKIGIAILVIGVGFFVKYAIDKNWIGEIGRVGIGIGTGAILMGLAHYLKKKYRAFSSVLIGGGISVFYYTISIAYHDYALFTQPQAFGIMSVITVLSAAMAVWYDRKELAIISLVGGFTTPFMVQGETNNYMAFFTYLAILNMGMLILSYFKKWSILNKLSLGFTLLFFGSWMWMEDVTYGDKLNAGIIFSNIYFIQFLGMNLLYNLSHRLKFKAWEFIQTISVIVLYYTGMLYLLSQTVSGDYRGVFTISFAGLMGLLAALTYKLKKADKNLTKLLIANTITFSTIFVLVQFKGDYLALFWSIEAVVLLLLGRYFQMKILRNASFFVLLFSIGGLIKLWFSSYVFGGQLQLVFNEAFMTGLFTIGTYVASYFVLRKSNDKILGVWAENYKSGVRILILISSYLVFLFELLHQIGVLNSIIIETSIIWLYHFLILFVFQLIANQGKSQLLKQIGFVVGSLLMSGYLLLSYDNTSQMVRNIVSGGMESYILMIHISVVILFFGSLFMLKRLSLSIFDQKAEKGYIYIFLSLIGTTLLTTEMNHLAIYFFAKDTSMISEVVRQTQLAGYTVLWGLISFALMIYGMRKKFRMIRIFALIGFTVSLIKLFAFDIQDISEAGKIVAFISLGVILLVISFLYQKLKQIIVDGELEKEKVE